MNRLKEKIMQEGRVLGEGVLKVDAFLNHQIDPQLMWEIGQTFSRMYAKEGVTKVLTLESSGIAPAVMTALQLGVPTVFARKQKSLTLNQDLLTETVYSYTKQQKNEVTISRQFMAPGERVLIIDDFLANGEAATGLARLVERAEAVVAGFGIVIEKSFQEGASRLAAAGYRVDSLARIASLSDGQIVFAE
ncbi:xanthine phosphoribosyltransferase [Paenibacillus beijingensis]|uniref:Xanthine phosphoribosyltransferase n=1 Tax=Paenibacillus beijingensis TaxID=1126833 RepID=A0A0D5NLB9_9BACL|nr:xanthine phosphoribosyltransferase [Paenibacillus beijingensis]AJY75945.1 xanthine phosphoribosyltransferase [Paenibacillus beijingensis]